MSGDAKILPTLRMIFAAWTVDYCYGVVAFAHEFGGTCTSCLAFLLIQQRNESLPESFNTAPFPTTDEANS
jgi:hypothetical protein